MTSQPDRPRSLRQRAEIDRRLGRIDEPHVAPLTRWVRDLRAREPLARIPFFDPVDAGVDARVLWLLEAPGPKATVERGGSGFISMDNNDGTAENTFETFHEAGGRRDEVLLWNVVPHYLGDDDRIAPSTTGDLDDAGVLLTELLALLPQLQVVVLGGQNAQQARDRAQPEADLQVLRCPHPSPRNLNPRPASRMAIVAAWRSAFGDR